MTIQQRQQNVLTINIMKNLILLFSILLAMSCRAQDIYPLKTLYSEVPNYSYLKDTNNELQAFVGTYEASFEGKKITLYITKHIKKLLDRGTYFYYNDLLIANYMIRDTQNNILKDSRTIEFTPKQIRDVILSFWTEDAGKKLIMSYGGVNCNVGNGYVYLTKLNANQLSWEYISSSTILTNDNCPPGSDIKVYLPKTDNLIFTKVLPTGGGIVRE